MNHKEKTEENTELLFDPTLPFPTELPYLPVVWSALSQKSPKKSIRAACRRKHTAHVSKHRGVMRGLRRREQCCCLCKSRTRSPHVNKASTEFQRQTCPGSPQVGCRYFPLKLRLQELLLSGGRQRSPNGAECALTLRCSISFILSQVILLSDLCPVC